MDNTAFTDLFRHINNLERRIARIEKSQPETGAWAAWTPAVTQSGSVAVTVSNARYMLTFNAVVMLAHLSVTGAGTAANAIVVSGIPYAPAYTNDNAAIGAAHILNSGTAYYTGTVVPVGANDFRFLSDDSTDYIGISPSFGLVAGDAISFMAVYERA